MKLTTAHLKKLIKEELQSTLREMEEEHTPDFYYNRLLTLMSFESEVQLAEMTYLSMKDQLTPEQQAFLDSCVKALELAREACKTHDSKAYPALNREFNEALREIFNNAPKKDDLHKKAFLGVREAAVNLACGWFGMLDL